MSEPRFKQEYFVEFANDKFYETTVRHKFKPGDIVRVKKNYIKYYGSSEFKIGGIEFSKESNTEEWIILYKSDTYHKNWINEYKIELVERTL